MAMFSQRHYVAIASVLDQLDGQLGRLSHLHVVKAFADMLAKDNPRFDASLFYSASGHLECIVAKPNKAKRSDEPARYRLIVGGNSYEYMFQSKQVMLEIAQEAYGKSAGPVTLYKFTNGKFRQVKLNLV